MQVKSEALLAVCLFLALLVGNTSACNNGQYFHSCEHQAVLEGWAIRNGSCVLHTQYLAYPAPCMGCSISADVSSSSIRLRAPSGASNRCRYGDTLWEQGCRAYCLDADGNIEHGTYQCFSASSFTDSCDCTNVCNMYNS